MKNHLFQNQKRLWVIGGVIFLILVCSLVVSLGGGMAEMMKSHMGM